MADTLLDMNSLTMPPGYCWPASVQSFVDHITANMKAVFPGTLTSFNYGSSTPAAVDRDKPWINTNDGRLYVYSGSYAGWISPHPIEFSSGYRAMFVGTATAVEQLDGGTAGMTATDATGPFWEIDTNLAGKFPVGVSDDIANAATGGAEEVTLTSLNLPSHTHEVYTGSSDGDFTSVAAGLQTIDSNSSGGGDAKTPIYRTSGGTGNSNPYIKAWGGNPATSNTADAFSIMPPYYGIYFIKRTARKYFLV